MPTQPLSLDELLAQKSSTSTSIISTTSTTTPKTKFLTKRQRETMKQLKLQEEEQKQQLENERRERLKTTLNHHIQPNPPSISSKPTNQPPNKPPRDRKRRFNFDWDLEEDTLGNFEPLVELPNAKKQANTENTTTEIHWSQKPLAEMTDRDWRIMREDYNISSKGGKVPNPLRDWHESNVSPLIIEKLEHLGYQEPTPIQRAAIPMGLTGRDTVGIAETGSGKTLAFLVPILDYILKLPRLESDEGPYVLIMVPTRELALQIEKEFQKFQSLGFDVASLIGGHSYDENIAKFARGVEVAIGTPGRLVDCLEKEIMTLSKCFFLVMDEADRMVDMGFETDLNKVLDSLPKGESNPYGRPKRTTMMFTATLPPAIQKIATSYLQSPGTVMVGEVGGAVDTVRQDAIQVTENEDQKLQLLQRILGRRQFAPPIIVFANFKRTCETVAEYLGEMGFKAVTMHGSKTQEQRESSIQQIRSGSAEILVATDVAGRGIDIPDVSLVVNYQMSRNIEDYTHRIGRTGRAGKRGTAITFWNASEDREVLYQLRQMLVKSPASRCPEDLRRNELAQRRVVRNIDS